MFDNTHEFRFESATCEVQVKDGRGLVMRVYSKHRGRGHARGLLRLVTEWADENGIELYLRAQGYGGPTQTMLDNNQLIKFYESFGFERDGDDICMSNVPMSRFA
jgi:GNAT superfamily N-acetyltransferase